jgi:putative ABC transport system substrate-binding protein
MLLTGSPSNPQQPPEVDAFIEELRRLGWVEGKNLAVERRWADKPDRFRKLASDLARSDVSVILTPGPAATRAAQDATSTIPIVMVAFTDPRQVGVASLAHPGGNLTGLTIGQPDALFAKRLELFKEAISRLSRVAVLWAVSGVDMRRGIASMTVAAQTLGLRLRHLRVNSPDEFDGVFKAAKRDAADGLLSVDSPRAVANRLLIAELGLKYTLPVMSEFRPMVEAGAFMSYGPDLNELFRRAAGDVDKILRGTKPADLPIQQPTKFELAINLKTAKALGLTIPPSLLLRADEVIQ